MTVTLPGRVAEVGTSNSTQYALLTDGSLYAWGLGTDGGGELCLGTKTAYSVPVRLPLSQVTTLAGASNHAVYDAGGTVYACGQDVAGDLGAGSRRSSATPVKVAGLDGGQVSNLVASFANSGALLSDGEYFNWGDNGHGQLGNGHLHHSSDVPVRVQLRLPVTQVAQGGSLWNNGQTLVMLSDGSVWAWGDDRAGQLGDGTRGMQPSPERLRPPAGVTYKSLATGSATSYGISAAGAVYAWGVSHVGQVGDGHTRTALAPVLVATGATSISSTANNVVINVPGNTCYPPSCAG